ncbi:hypothetical protein HDV03_000964 [Kappamyces sp. JEL0829]|nr:hypothetical protein HDV03_000964 [Kappamyces sp. JEL0829]
MHKLQIERFSLDPKIGFHSNIQLEWKNSANPNEKSLLVVGLSSAFFADPFELERIEWKNNTRIKVLGNVDLEAGAYSPAAQPHYLVVHLSNTVRHGSISLPFHLRYQAPTRGVSHQEIEPPKPYLVHVADVELCDPSLRVRSARVESYLAPLGNCSQVQDLCSEAIVFKVPVGNPDWEAFISRGTFLVSLLGVVVTIWSLYQAKRNSGQTVRGSKAAKKEKRE